MGLASIHWRQKFQSVRRDSTIAAQRLIEPEFRESYLRIAVFALFPLILPGCSEESGPKPDTTPPAAIQDLEVAAVSDSSVVLTWTATGDNGGAGTAREYDVRYSTTYITTHNWFSRDRFTGIGTPRTAGEVETLTVSGLEPGRSHYFGIKAADDTGNWSDGSNITQASTERLVARRIVLFPNGTGDFATIQEAVDASIEGDTLLLKDGVYNGENNRDILISNKGLTIISESSDPERCVIDCAASHRYRHRAFLFVGRGQSQSRVRGVTITTAYAPDDSSGGAILCLGTSPEFINCSFEDSFSKGQGGAVYCDEGSSPRMVDCIFSDNTSREGGGAMACAGNAYVVLESCQFLRNEALQGGAILTSDSSIRIVGCQFHRNKARYHSSPTASAGEIDSGEYLGGGVFLRDQSNVTLDDCVFLENVAPTAGGAVASGQGCHVVVRNSVFTANESGDGGAVYCDRSSPVFEACGFSANRADYGGAVALIEASPSLSGCVFLADSAHADGGALYCRHSAFPWISECTFISESAGRFGGGIAFIDSHPSTLERCTFYGCLADSAGSAVALTNPLFEITNTILSFGRQTTAVHCMYEGSPELSCCDIYGNTGGDWVGPIADQVDQTGNMTVDPLFVDASIADLRLQPESPCLGGDCEQIGASSSGQLPTILKSLLMVSEKNWKDHNAANSRIFSTR